MQSLTPVHLQSDTLDIQFCARHFDDATLFRIGLAYQLATDWHKRVAPILG